MNVDDFVHEIEEVPNMDLALAIPVVFLKDFFVVDVNYAILHVQLFVVHLVLLADLAQGVLEDEEELLLLQDFFILLVVVAPDHCVDLVELLLS